MVETEREPPTLLWRIEWQEMMEKGMVLGDLIETSSSTSRKPCTKEKEKEGSSFRGKSC